MSVNRNIAFSLGLSLTDRVVLKLPIPLLTLCVCGRTGYFGFLSFQPYFQPILNVTFYFDYSIHRLFTVQFSTVALLLSRLIDSLFTSGQFSYH